MSSEQPNNSQSGPEPKKSNTALIVIIVLAVLTIPVLCICGLAGGVAFLQSRQAESILHERSIDSGRAIDGVPTDSPIELVPPVKAVPPPIEAAPPVKPAPTEKLQSGDEASSK